MALFYNSITNMPKGCTGEDCDAHVAPFVKGGIETTFRVAAISSAITLWGDRENGENYLLRVIIGIVETANTERHPHEVGNIARLHLLHDRGPVMLDRPCADP